MTKMRIPFSLLAMILVALLASACGSHDHGPDDGHGHDHDHDHDAPVAAQAKASSQTAPTVAMATARIQSKNGSSVTGDVSFSSVPGGIRVQATIAGLEPGDHGFHVHEFGDCSSDDGKSAGGHFNPHGSDHGALGDEHSHVGDLGNLHADASGQAELDFVTDKLSLGSGMENVLGRGLIIHAKADDLKSQPTGAAGARMGCGVILGAGTVPVTKP